MAKVFRNRKRIAIFIAVLVAAILAIIMGVRTYAAYEERLESEKQATRIAEIGNALEAAAVVGIHAITVDDEDDTPKKDDLAKDTLPDDGTSDAIEHDEEMVTEQEANTYQQDAVPNDYDSDYSAHITVPDATGSGHTTQGQDSVGIPAPAAAPAQTWIVTKAAWTEQVPMYEQQYRQICSNPGCGADISGGAQAHFINASEQDRLNGCGTWHSEYRDILVGYSEVYHPEEGYWQ